ncbi:MAG: sigma-70 family RNA polymerase sigma factor [Nitrospirota bacterium]
MDKEDIITELVLAVPQGDEGVFKKLYEITNKRVFNYLYRLVHDKNMAEDLLMETFTEVWRSAKRFRAESKGLTWMIGIARNRAMNMLRNRKIKEYDINEHMEDLSEQSHNCEEAETSAVLEQALNKLPAIHREVLDLIFMQGMVYKDVALITGVPLNTVKSRVFYAKENLKNILVSMGIAEDDLL